MVITVGVSAVLGFSFYLRRRTKRLQSENQHQFNKTNNYRPLFAPTDEEISAFELEESLKAEAKKKDEARQLSTKKTENVRQFRKVWLNEPNKGNTIELLRLASESKSAQYFSETAENIIEFWNDRKIKNLTAEDLADLLDSHFRTLPQQERSSGALFWLKQEITSIRRKSEDFN